MTITVDSWRELVPPDTAMMGFRRPNPPRKKTSGWSVDEASLDPYGEHKGLLVRTALVRSKDYAEGLRQPPRIANSRDVAKLCAHLKTADQEHFAVLACNNAKDVVAIFEAALGGTAQAAVEIPHILKIPLLTSSPAVVIVHNHPSGKADPSAQDIEYTRDVYKALNCVGLTLLDHVIVSSAGHFSFLDSGMMPRG